MKNFTIQELKRHNFDLSILEKGQNQRERELIIYTLEWVSNHFDVEPNGGFVSTIIEILNLLNEHDKKEN